MRSTICVSPVQIACPPRSLSLIHCLRRATPIRTRALPEGQAEILEAISQLAQGFSRLEQSQSRLEQSQSRLEQSQSRLEQSQSSLLQSQSRLEQSQSSLLQSHSRLERNQGGLREHYVRQQVRDLFGGHYARQFTVRSVQDIIRLMPEFVVYGNHQDDRRSLSISKQLVTHLQPVPLELLKAIQDHHEVRKQEQWISPSGQLEMENLGHFIGLQRDLAFKTALTRLKKAASADNLVEELLGCDGAGIMCAIAASDETRYIERLDVPFPPDELQIDLRGRMEFYGDQPLVYIDVGEVKSSADFSTAVPQLGRSLKLLKWCVRTLFSDAQVTCIGRMFVPGSDNRLYQEQQQRAFNEWGFSLYVHHLL